MNRQPFVLLALVIALALIVSACGAPRGPRSGRYRRSRGGSRAGRRR